MINKLVFLAFIGALYLPVFGKALPPFQERQETFVNYGVPLALAIGLLALVLAAGRKQADRFRDDPLFWPAIFLFLYCAIWTAKGMAAGLLEIETLTLLRTKLAGPLYGLCAIAVWRQLGAEERYSRFVAWCFLGPFMLQVGLSALESVRGVGFGKYEIGYVGEIGLEGRDMMEAMGMQALGRFGFIIPFSGQIGQHNGFGNVLVFYNIIILLFLAGNARRWWAWALVVACAFAVVGNTTRVAILAIVLADAIVLPSVVGAERRVLRLFIRLATVLALLFGIGLAWDRLVDMTSRVNSMALRFQLWEMVLSDAGTHMSVLSAFFGFDGDTLSTLGVFYRNRSLGSVENQFLALLLDSGLVGCALFIWVFLVRPLQQSLRRPAVVRHILWMFCAGIVLAGLTMDLHLHFTSIVVLLACYDALLARPFTPLVPTPLSEAPPRTGRPSPGPGRAPEPDRP